MTLTQDQMKNSRSTPAGAKADAATRRNSGSKDGMDAGHRHGTYANADPKDRNNVFRQDSIQNRPGGTKYLHERRTAAAMKKDPTLSIEEKSTVVNQLNRPGYGARKPIAEKVEHTHMRDGKPIMHEGRPVGGSVSFGQFKGSAQREVEKAAARGQTVSAQRQEQLHQQDRRNFGTTAAKDQARAAQMRQPGGPAMTDRRAMARQYAAQQQPAGSNVVPLQPVKARAPEPKTR